MEEQRVGRKKQKKVKMISQQKSQRNSKNSRDLYVCSGFAGQKYGKGAMEFSCSESERSKPPLRTAASQILCAHAQRTPEHSNTMADNLHELVSKHSFCRCPKIPKQYGK